MLKIGVLVSGGGTNLQAIIDAIETKEIQGAQIVTVVSNKDKVYALERAARHNIPSTVLLRKNYGSREEYDEALISHLQSCEVDLVVMAGFLVVVGKKFVEAFKNKVINVHPSLIPSFCGDGFYGLKVHEAALEYGVKLAGATVHFVDVETDAGPVILQKSVPILEGDTPEILQKRVMEEVEWEILPKAISLFVENRLEVEGRIVRIKGGEIA